MSAMALLNLRIAARNVARNRRRSTITSLAIALGACATLLLGALMSYIVLEFQTSTVRRTGHLSVFQPGFFAYGVGDPASYGIPDYQRVMGLVTSDPTLGPLVRVASPMQVVSGVAGNSSANATKTFAGQGVVPADRWKMNDWNQYGVQIPARRVQPLRGDDAAAVGAGLARILHVCEGRPVPGCPAAAPDAVPAAPEAASAAEPPANEADASLLALAARVHGVGAGAAGGTSAGPHLDLLAATAGGAPNVVSVAVERVDSLGNKDADDSFLAMQLPLAQRLVYGRGQPRATAITLQLHRTEDMPAARAALARLFAAHGLKLEVRDFTELTPLYTQVLAFFGFLFGFISIVIGVIVLFTTTNTMTMSVMERTAEIGTARALGAQRGELRLQFLTEGALLGVIGATAGTALAVVLVAALNAAHLTWSPPTSAGPVPLQLFLLGNPLMVAGLWIGLALAATLASMLPAQRAARLEIVDALRHV